MDNAGEVIARFLNGLTKEDGRVGFHPSIRNFAVINDRAVFFDSFPPLIHYTHAEMAKFSVAFRKSVDPTYWTSSSPKARRYSG